MKRANGGSVIQSVTEEEIVITATMRNDGLTSWFMDLDRSRSQNPVLETYLPTGGTSLGSSPTTGNANDGNVSSSVNVRVAKDSLDLAEAMKAAENVAKTLARIESLLNDLAPNTPIEWADEFGNTRQMTAAQVLSEIANTQYIISDRMPSNGGVGEALRGQNGAPNIDTLYFEAFDGDRDPYKIGTITYTNDYADVNYTDNQGMMGVMLHELGHMSDAGLIFNQGSEAYYIREHGNLNGYSNSEYWSNNEAFANDFATHVGLTMGFDVSSVTSNMVGGWAMEGRGATDWHEPGRIFADNTYQSPPMFEYAESARGLDDLYVRNEIV